MITCDKCGFGHKTFEEKRACKSWDEIAAELKEGCKQAPCHQSFVVGQRLSFHKGETAMPMSFPDMKSLEMAAECWKFRAPKEGETEEQYRASLADHVQPEDLIESLEIRNKVGWDKFTKEQNQDMIRRSAAMKRHSTA